MNAPAVFNKANLLLTSFFIIICTSAYGNKTDSIFAALDHAIKHKQQYARQKEERIAGFRSMITGDLPLLPEYHLNESLYKEYQKFRLDSAIYYVKRNVGIANITGRKDLNDAAQLQLATLYASSGRYRESEAILKAIRKDLVPERSLAAWYETFIQFFEHYATNSYSDEYMQQIKLFRDSLLTVSEPSSLRYKINLAEKNIYEGRESIAEKDLSGLLDSVKENNPQYAMITYLLGNIYRKRAHIALSEKYYTMSAIADIKNSVKDHASIQNLALICYEAGDIDRAYRYTRSAVEDAIFCNVQFRTLHLSEFYSIINTAYLEKEAKQKGQLQLYLLFISILTVFLVLAILYVYKQMKRVSGIRKELYQANEKLVRLNAEISEANDQLQERNAQLSDSNHIKEEYIAHFFNLCSAYINKLEDYRKMLNKKATGRQLDELLRMLRSTTLVDNELEELYRNFDTIFLNLYPTFVKDFNTLLCKEEQVTLKPGELLNTELRIFALIRLGITDSVKIASFLRYSLSTIYNYRTKARNKAAISRDQFEDEVMKIGTLSGKTH